MSPLHWLAGTEIPFSASAAHFHRLDAEHAVAGARHRDARTLSGLRDEDADHRIARRGVGELGIARFLRHREADGGDDFALFQRGLEHALEVVVGGDAALAGLDGGAQAQSRRRIVGRGIVVGEGAADRAAVAHLRIADGLGQRGEGGERLLHVLRAGHLGMRRQRADRDLAALDLDTDQVLDPAQVDHFGRLGEALLQGRDQRHPAGHQLGVFGLGETGGVGEAAGAVIGEIVHGGLRYSAAWRG
jgi:hypothetical protein